jgi:Ni,Fe-hydrogenase I cytochrome b subunit
MAALPVAPIAMIHVAAAYATAVFLIGHVYMITTGATVFQHLKAMLTGYETVEMDERSRPSAGGPDRA